MYCIFLILHLLDQLSYQGEENQAVLLSACSSQIHVGYSLVPHYPPDAEKLVGCSSNFPHIEVGMKAL